MKRLFEAKPVLDEREMQEMYRIDHAALWATVSLLCASVIVQLLLGADFAQMAGELVVLCVAAVGMFIAYARRGIWDESSRPSLASNAVCAAVDAAMADAEKGGYGPVPVHLRLPQVSHSDKHHRGGSVS